MRLIDVPGLNNIIQNIDMVTSLLQESIMQTRLQPISVVFAKFPRLVRDLAKKLDKEINLTLVGQDVELDKSIIEQLSDPLTHLIRNSVDHGIELPQARAAEGKPAQGEVVLRAFHEGGKVHIQIEDDGAGINRVRVKEKALQLCILNRRSAGRDDRPGNRRHHHASGVFYRNGGKRRIGQGRWHGCGKNQYRTPWRRLWTSKSSRGKKDHHHHEIAAHLGHYFVAHRFHRRQTLCHSASGH